MQGMKMKGQIPLGTALASSSVNVNSGQFQHRKIIALQNILTDYPKSFLRKSWLNLSVSIN